MLRKYQKSIISSLAKELLQMGMIWGNELEEYIKVSLKGEILIQNDAHYLEIENYFLDIVEKEINKFIEVREEGEVKRVRTIKDAAKISGISYLAIISKLRYQNKTKIKSKKNGKVVEFEILKPSLDKI